jgi:hypothetical protein
LKLRRRFIDGNGVKSLAAKRMSKKTIEDSVQISKQSGIS